MVNHEPLLSYKKFGIYHHFTASVTDILAKTHNIKQHGEVKFAY
ncbi:hypothetical protein SLEP1_g22431 [Rubroshorea leprosula]|uniref:Uncharacterized protein n=1 Tax=Rubroshorea leprosula TaxID=152421 RepID=A0AAV5JII8_9ROSI|nr:hypothetical protein SLEP1_g22431 [Rubroshorea leprosula]